MTTATLADITRGDTLAYKLTFTTDANPGVAVDVTGWEFWMTFKVNLGDPDILAPLQMFYDNPTAPSTGIVTLEIPGDCCDDLPIGLLYWDIQVVIPASSTHAKFVQTVLSGTVNVVSDVTITSV
jgi:hypothetical protein